jgi:AraC-like DNA-binding protein
MGASPMPRTWGLVSHLAMSAPTPLIALSALMNYSRLQLDFAQFDLDEPEDSNLILSWQSNTPRRPSRHVIEHMFANIVALSNSQIGYPTHTIRIEFKHNSAGNTEHMEKVLNADVSFDCDADRIFVPKLFLELPSRYDQDDLFTYTEDLARLINSVRGVILNQLPFGLPKIDDTAKALDITPRTLQRRLLERQLKYQVLLDDVRRELARGLIIKPELTLSDVADYLGFNDQSAFQHAFQRWEGTTPGKFRKDSRGRSLIYD